MVLLHLSHLQQSSVRQKNKLPCSCSCSSCLSLISTERKRRRKQIYSNRGRPNEITFNAKTILHLAFGKESLMFLFFSVSPTHVRAGKLKAMVFKSKVGKKLCLHVGEMSDVWIKK
jgi:hypothetical protein